MEYIDGEDLSGLLRRIGRLPRGKALELAGQLCRGLSAAHEAGVLHRDLKPANVMIDGRGRAKITDFGLAFLRDEIRQSDPRHFVGTPAYMAPEQLIGARFTERTDVFSLGLVLYEMFTGERAFADEPWLELVARGRRGSEPRDPTDYVEGFDPDISSMLMHCLAEDPAERPPGALAVLAGLPGGDPLRAALEAGETPSPEVVAAAADRHALTVSQGAGLLVALVLSIGFFHATADRTTLLGMVAPEIPIEALESRARMLLYDVGWRLDDGRSADSFRAFRFEEGAIDSFASRGDRAPSASDWNHRVGQRPRLITFYLRTSDAALVEPLLGHPDWFPESRPGSAFVLLDTLGRLERLRIDPRRGVVSDEGRPDWQEVLDWAEIDLASLEALPPPALNAGEQPLPVHDARRGWSARIGGEVLRVDAASFGSLPVFFQLSSPAETVGSPYSVLSDWLFFAFYGVLFLAALAATGRLSSPSSGCGIPRLG